LFNNFVVENDYKSDEKDCDSFNKKDKIEDIKVPAYHDIATFRNISNFPNSKISIENSENVKYLQIKINENENNKSIINNKNLLSSIDNKENIIIFDNIGSKIQLKKGLLSNDKLTNNHIKMNCINSSCLNTANSNEEYRSTFDLSNYNKCFIDNDNQKQNLKNKYDSINDLLGDLEKFCFISIDQKKNLIKKYEYKEKMILEAWEVYKHNSNLNELIYFLKIICNDVRKIESLNRKENGSIPLAISTKNKNIVKFFSYEDKEQKDFILAKQINIIELLIKENLINKLNFELIKKLIFKENLKIISAFEVLSVNRDISDFSETITIIIEEFHN